MLVASDDLRIQNIVVETTMPQRRLSHIANDGRAMLRVSSCDQINNEEIRKSESESTT